MVEGDIEEELEQEEVVLEQQDVDNRTWEEVVGDIDQPSIFHPDPEIRHTRRPTVWVLSTHLVDKHGTTHLIPTIKHNDLNLSLDDKFSIWYQCKMFHSPPPYKPTGGPRVETIQAFPAIVDRYGHRRQQAQFNTALYVADLDRTSIFWYRACHVRAIFELPKNLQPIYSRKLTYVELFNLFHGPDLSTDLYWTSHSFVDTRRDILVMLLSQLRMACHIALRYGTATADLDLGIEPDILSTCKKFVYNNFGSFFLYELMHHWLNIGAME
ncbi:hypothetical protein FRC10_002622 [Ceratobasidium sp. 414]|nr:hypothetical protein FRC10_002622 [Ceratobasidium sp. 414]